MPPGALLRLGTISLQHAGQVDRLGFSADGKELFSCGNDILRRWQIETGHEIAHFDFRDAVRKVVDYALTPDWKNAIVVYGHPDYSLGPHFVEMYDVSSKQRIQEFSIPHRQSIALDTSGRVLTANSSKIEIWDVKTARVTSSIPFAKKNAQLLLRASGDTLIAIDGGYDAHVFDIKREAELRSFGRGTSGSIWVCWLSQNGKWVESRGGAVV
jgi:WD40 repeat protein